MGANLECCAADMDDHVYAYRGTGGQFLPQRGFIPESKRYPYSRRRDTSVTSATQSSHHSHGGEEIESLSFAKVPDTEAFVCISYHSLLQKMEAYDEQFAQMNGDLATAIGEVNQLRGEVEILHDQSYPSLSYGSSDYPRADTNSSHSTISAPAGTSSESPSVGSVGKIEITDELIRGKKEPTEATEMTFDDTDMIDSISLTEEVEAARDIEAIEEYGITVEDNKEEREHLTKTRSSKNASKSKDEPEEKYVPVETPALRIEKFIVYKKGPRDIGRIHSDSGWTPAKYDLDNDNGAFLGERLTKAKRKKSLPKYGKFHTHKAGPREIGRIKGWKAADYGLDLKEISTGDFLKARSSYISSGETAEERRRRRNLKKNNDTRNRLPRKKSSSTKATDSSNEPIPVKRRRLHHEQESRRSSASSVRSETSTYTSIPSTSTVETASSTSSVTIPRKRRKSQPIPIRPRTPIEKHEQPAPPPETRSGEQQNAVCERHEDSDVTCEQDEDEHDGSLIDHEHGDEIAPLVDIWEQGLERIRLESKDLLEKKRGVERERLNRSRSATFEIQHQVICLDKAVRDLAESLEQERSEFEERLEVERLQYEVIMERERSRVQEEMIIPYSHSRSVSQSWTPRPPPPPDDMPSSTPPKKLQEDSPPKRKAVNFREATCILLPPDHSPLKYRNSLTRPILKTGGTNIEEWI